MEDLGAPPIGDTLVDDRGEAGGKDPRGVDELPSRDELMRLIGATHVKAAAQLRTVLARCAPGAPLDDQLGALAAIGRYVVAGAEIPTAGNAALIRLEWLVLALERIPAARTRFCAAVGSVLAQTRAIRLFGEVGLPNDRGLIAETMDRLARKFLPEPPARNELWILASRIVRKLDDLSWLGPAADPLLARLAAAGGDAWDPLRAQMLDAVGLIITRIAAQGMGEAFRGNALESVRMLPLYRLTRCALTDIPHLVEDARRQLEQVRVALEDHGVSIEVVYAIDSIERGLARIELLLPFVLPAPAERTYEIRAVIAAVGRALVAGRSFGQLMSDNMRLLARKVIERAGRSGEHYVTSSRREYFGMLRSAAGGGVLTLGTALVKFFVKWGHFAPFLDGFLSSVDYAASFVLMQLVGFTLATKQPSMTAAALAGTIRKSGGPGHQLDELVPLIARIARSQFAAAMGNVFAVAVSALIFDFLYRRATGAPFLDAETAKHVVESFDPLGSLTILWAALTGVLLWVSSIAAGWFENWVVYRRIPEAIEHHRFGRRLGSTRMSKLARFLEHEAAGFGGSVALGFLLGMLPAFGKFFGIPLDVRHITLSTGSLTLSISSIGVHGAGVGGFVAAIFGIAIIGLLNFGVSFALALVVALRARDVPRGERRTLPRAVLRRFFKRPLEFFYPPKDPVGLE